MKYKVNLNGRFYEVEVERGEAILNDVYEAATTVPGPAPVAVAAASTPLTKEDGEVITSPLPGTVLRLAVNAGDAVQKGQVLLTIEAMKMENDITAPKEGLVSYVAVRQGVTVNTGDTLVILS